MGERFGAVAGLVSAPDAVRAPGATLSGRKVLVTGHTGFKGSWLCSWLLGLGAEVAGYALEPDTEPALFEQLGLAKAMSSTIADIRDAGALRATLERERPQVVLHLAAQPLVRYSYREPVETFDVNVMGTLNLLEQSRSLDGLRGIVVVTTDKVYENPETGRRFAEADPLGGHDPYSASKACAEIVTASYRRSFLAEQGVAVATARAGNVLGGGDWAADRIGPDCARALSAGAPIVVRNPGSVRPWQHVLDSLSGYLTLAERLLGDDGSRFAQAYNFGPDAEDSRTVGELAERFVSAWGEGEWQAPAMGDQPHEAGLLELDNAKARADLGWRPTWGFDESVTRTAEWYRAAYAGEPAAELVARDIAAFAR